VTLDGELEVAPFDEAVEQVLDVIDAANGADLADRLRQLVSEVGSERALGHIRGMAHALASTQTSATIIQRTPARDAPRESQIKAADAERLQQLLDRTEQVTETIYRVGRLSGVRWTAGSFDLDTGHGEVISGRVIRDLRDAIRPIFDTLIRAELQRTITRTPGADQGRTRWLLVGLSEPPPEE
jgi:hypothetical protein